MMKNFAWLHDLLLNHASPAGTQLREASTKVEPYQETNAVGRLVLLDRDAGTRSEICVYSRLSRGVNPPAAGLELTM